VERVEEGVRCIASDLPETAASGQRRQTPANSIEMRASHGRAYGAANFDLSDRSDLDDREIAKGGQYGMRCHRNPIYSIQFKL
jgi:hypothetical protein